MALFGNKKKNLSIDGKIKEEPQDKEVVEIEDGKKPEVIRRPVDPKGGDDHAYGVIVSPHMTEKASLMAEQNKYVFKVSKFTSKIEIKKAIEKMYKVKVKNVAVAMKPSKARRMGRHEGVKAGFKKAIVTLIKGDKIDIIS